jgi:hypothetical protein
MTRDVEERRALRRRRRLTHVLGEVLQGGLNDRAGRGGQAPVGADRRGQRPRDQVGVPGTSAGKCTVVALAQHIDMGLLFGLPDQRATMHDRGTLCRKRGRGVSASEYRGRERFM